jgi:hypothetical protein
MSTLEGWERVAMAINEVRERLLRCSAALEAAGVPYAIAGGNAVAEWVGRVDKAAVRFTQDVDIVLRRVELPQAVTALTHAGFVYHESFGVTLFLDGPSAGPRDAVHLVFAGEKVKPHDEFSVPELGDVELGGVFRVVSLQSLVVMKLTAFRRKDQVHLLDMLSVGLIDESWLGRVPPSLALRLRELLDNPE